MIGGHRTGVDNRVANGASNVRGDRATELRKDVGYRLRRSREWLSIDSDLSRFVVKNTKYK